MDSGDASIPRRRTRQQFLKFCVNFIEKRNRSCQNGNPTGFSTCSVNIKEDVSRGRKRKMVEESTDFGSDKTIMRILEDGSMVRNRDKGQKKSGQWERDDDILKQPFIKEISDDDDNSEEEANDSDVVAIGEAAAGSAVNTGSGSWSNVGYIGFKSSVLNVADEVVSSTSNMCWTVKKPEEFAITNRIFRVEI
ncbi:putative chromodomain-helicase-DNA-binding protein 8-like [Capsicum annuum]|nr:putative chromodomain-helicase-DNA-binding protein 8-like [Capsicum annuum]